MGFNEIKPLHSSACEKYDLIGVKYFLHKRTMGVFPKIRVMDSFNSLRAKLFRVNINIYLHFMSLLHTN